MLLEELPIKRIICENLNDIEIEENSKMIYFQVKSTSAPSLARSAIIESVQLFAAIEARNEEMKYDEYVLVSNSNINKIHDSMIKHPFSELDENLRGDIYALDLRPQPFFERLYLLKGPALEEISHILRSMILKALKNNNYGSDAVDGIKNDLLSHIGSMCPGQVDLEDSDIIYQHEQQARNLDHKSINTQILKEIIENNRPDSPGQNRRQTVSATMIFKYHILPTYLNDARIEGIHGLLREYDSLQNDDLKITYLQKFNDFSKRFDLYTDKTFLDFLERHIKNGTDKHIVLECLFILHSLILTSKVEHGDSFLAYVNKHYFLFLKAKSELGIPTYEYSLFKIEQIFGEIKNFIAVEEICEMYWKRMVKIIKE
jgi:hypothetical protein